MATPFDGMEPVEPAELVEAEEAWEGVLATGGASGSGSGRAAGSSPVKRGAKEIFSPSSVERCSSIFLTA